MFTKTVNTAAAILIVVSAAACSRPFDMPVFDAGGGKHGLAFYGLSDAVSESDVRVVWIHGMCRHDGAWALETFAMVRQQFGVSPGLEREIADGHPGDPERVSFSIDVGENRLSIDFLVWSPLTEAAKRMLVFDAPEAAGGKFPYERASLNDTLKRELLNDCLVDPLLYASPAGDAIREWVRSELCRSLGGTRSGRACLLPARRSRHATFVVSESLGSKIIFDAIRYFWDNARGVQRQRLAAEINSLSGIFLASNQLPLLDIADTPADQARALAAGREEVTVLSGLAEVIDEARQSGPRTFDAGPEPQPVQVVAFTDPNDLLSYRLLQEHLGPLFRLVNVIVSNDPTYLGFLENPLNAHLGYRTNPDVARLIVEGNPAD
ncbi:MAG TPA: hypothetical protein VMM36_06610 [Opitutaceae bacterium]|nr:hypothetical protein [Opitutaceae bacterium]